ncbi:MAG: CDC48 family AAA ATPase [Promethearchaeota archaeon]
MVGIDLYQDNPRKVRIKDAFKEDAGRGIIRIDPDVTNELNFKVGDVIKIMHPFANKNTVALLYTGKNEDKETNIIRMDPSLRKNLGASIDDLVEVKKIEANEAESITFSGLSLIPRDPQALARKLEKRVITKGDILSFYAMARRIDLVVLGFKPEVEAVKINFNTKILFSEKSTVAYAELRRPTIRSGGRSALEQKLQKSSYEDISYEDIGGLALSIQKIREIIELPLRHPELFDRIGIEAPKGVLLHGPPGTGKTLLAKAVAYETDAHFISISGPEIMSKFFGQSEENLRRIFEEGIINAPSIIFLDELDSIAPKREEGKSQVESRVVAQLLSLMDGLNNRGEIIVIAATNKVNNIDIALRRPGRFDREIEIKVPNTKGRYEILQIHTRGMPLKNDVDLKIIAEKTHGFVGADIKSLCKEAALLAIREIIPEIDLDKPIPEIILNQLSIKMNHLIEALTSIEPSALREVLITQPSESWNEIGGLEEAKQQLREIVEWPFIYPGFYEHMKSKPPNGILLFGVPGAGKTLMVKALAHETEINFISIKGPEFLSKWVGESAKAVRETFRKARTAAPCIIFFDEIDAIAVKRSEASGSHVVEQVVAQLLTEMDGLEELNNVVLIAATNRPDLLDPALLRSGRFGRHIEVPLPNKKSRIEIFKIHLSNRPVNQNINIEKLAELLEGYTGADIKAICEEATLLAIRRGVKDENINTLDPKSYENVCISQEELEVAIDKVKLGADKAKKSYKDLIKETPNDLYR